MPSDVNYCDDEFALESRISTQLPIAKRPSIPLSSISTCSGGRPLGNPFVAADSKSATYCSEVSTNLGSERSERSERSDRSEFEASTTEDNTILQRRGLRALAIRTDDLELEMCTASQARKEVRKITDAAKSKTRSTSASRAEEKGKCRSYKTWS